MADGKTFPFRDLFELLGVFTAAPDAPTTKSDMGMDREITLSDGNTVGESGLDWRDIPNEPGIQSASVRLRGPDGRVIGVEMLRRSKMAIQ